MNRVPSWLGQCLIVLEKDLKLELRSGEVLTTSCFFALLVVVTGSIALHSGDGAEGAAAPGVIWLSHVFAAVLALGKSWQREREDRALASLLVAPLSRSALFTGKVVGLCLFLLVVQAVIVPAAALFFNVDLLRHGPGLVLVSLMAIPGIAATGTLFGAMTVRTRARELILAIVLFPLLSPTLLSAIAASRALLDGASVAELGDYLKLIGVFDVVFITGGVTMFGTLVEG